MDDRCDQMIRNRWLKIDKHSLAGGQTKYLNSELSIYTDGSKIGGQVGSGVVVFKRKPVIFPQNARLPDSATVFQAEVYALLLAGKYILSQINDNHNYIQIHSDSQAAIRAIRKTEIKSQLVLDTCLLYTSPSPRDS